jgi:hypothetical protein
MRHSRFLRVLVLTLFGFALTVSAQAPQQSPPQGATAQQAPPFQMPPASEETLKHLGDLRKQIAGKENLPAAEVFKNIQVMKDAPAGRLLLVMRVAYAASLGVECSHCHVPGEWEKDDKAPKAIARQMWAFMRETNQRLSAIRPGAGVNCTTCHRGETKPALNLPSKP